MSEKKPLDSPNPAEILLVGPPNVGKSVIFNYFTGLNVSCANYSGTTVEYYSGSFDMLLPGARLIDVPGIYTLRASNEAEQVAVDILGGRKSRLPAHSGHCGAGDVIVEDAPRPQAVLCVLDALHLESSLFLFFSVLQFGLPVVVALNRMDLLQRKGISIDTAALADLLGVAVVPCSAPSGDGLPVVLDELRKMLGNCGHRAAVRSPASNEQGKWVQAETIAAEVSSRPVEPLTPVQDRSIAGQNNQSLLVRPWPGIPVAFLILGMAFGLVIGLGMGLRRFVLLPFFRGHFLPLVSDLVNTLVSHDLVNRVLIGEYGFLIKGFEWPFALVLPYVFSFYLVMAVLEDSGYLPRLGILLDGIMNRIGISGSSIIPLLLGYGCAIPAILATRALSSKKERYIAVSLICLAIPCISQSGAFITLLAERSVMVVVAVFIVSFFTASGAGLTLNKLLPGSLPQLVVELPELLAPRPLTIFKKLLTRTRFFIKDGAVPMFFAVAAAAVLYETGAMAFIGRVLAPLVNGWLRLPPDAAVPLILGIMRRELSILPLLDMDLTTVQLFTGAIVGLFYVPCIAVIATLGKEFKLPFALLVLLGTSSLAFLAGGLAARIAVLFGF